MGELNGKGKYEIKEPSYSYDGEWAHSKKEGKGIEKTKLTVYDGDFRNDKKNGKGSLIFYLNQNYYSEYLK